MVENKFGEMMRLITDVALPDLVGQGDRYINYDVDSIYCAVESTDSKHFDFNKYIFRQCFYRDC